MPVLKMPTSATPLANGSDLPFQSMAARSVSARGSDMPTLRTASPHSIEVGVGRTHARSLRTKRPRTVTFV